MATYTADMLVPRVVYPGKNLIINEADYLGDGSTTFKAGDLIRINTSGQVKNAATDSDTAGAVHGMVIKDYDTAPAATAPVAVALFDEDTIIRIQIYAAAGGDAQPQDVSVGSTYTLRDGGSGHWSITTTTTKGLATVVRQPSYDNPYDANLAIDKNYGVVDVKFARSILDGRAA